MRRILSLMAVAALTVYIVLVAAAYGLFGTGRWLLAALLLILFVVVYFPFPFLRWIFESEKEEESN